MNAVFCCKGGNGYSTCRVLRSKGAYLLFGQFGHPHAFAFVLSPLGNHVGSIIGLCSEEEMGRVDTGRVVAAVTDTQAFGNLPDHEFISEAMSKKIMASVVGYMESAVALLVSPSGPEDAPTVVFTADAVPESVKKRDCERLVCDTLADGKVATPAGAEPPVSQKNPTREWFEEELFAAGFANPDDFRNLTGHADSPLQIRCVGEAC